MLGGYHHGTRVPQQLGRPPGAVPSSPRVHEAHDQRWTVATRALVDRVLRGPVTDAGSRHDDENWQDVRRDQRRRPPVRRAQVSGMGNRIRNVLEVDELDLAAWTTVGARCKPAR